MDTRLKFKFCSQNAYLLGGDFLLGGVGDLRLGDDDLRLRLLGEGDFLRGERLRGEGLLLYRLSDLDL